MTNLKNGNETLLKKEYKAATAFYEKVLKEKPSLKKTIDFNLAYCTKKLSEEKENEKKSIHHSSSSDSGYEGYTDGFKNGFFYGWMVKKNDPSAVFDFKLKVNGVLFCTIKNDQPRDDLAHINKSTGLGGFAIQLPSELFAEPIQTIDIFSPDDYLITQLIVPLQASSTESPSALSPRIATYQYARDPVQESVSVIVPIYNAAEDLKVCIERLLQYTSPSVDIILIDDASPDKRIQLILDAASKHKNIRIYSNETNLGFTKTVNRCIELAGSNDVVFLNSDARVTPRWLEGLTSALATDSKIATVTPMSDRAGAFSAPNIGNDNPLPDGVKEADYAVAFRRRSFGFYPTVPTGNGFCLYVRRACIDEISTLDKDAFPRGYGEENDFCMRARAAGWRNVIDDRTYVFHDRNKSFGEEKTELMAAGRKIIDERYPDYQKAIGVFTQSSLIQLARYRSRIALKDVETLILPRGLFVISTLTGGTPQTNRDLMLSVSGDVEPWLLHCDSKVISLYKVNKYLDDELIEQYSLKEAIEPLTHTSSEYDQVVMSWLAKFDFELVHIRHLAWHSLNLPKLAKTAGARVIMSFHDYYAVCPTVKLLDNERKFCGGKCTSSSGQCSPELWAQDSFPYLKNNWVHTWRNKFKEAVKDCDAYVTTHHSAKETLVEQLGIDDSKFQVIPHGRDFKELCQLAVPYKQGDVLKILVPGNINDAKGSNLIEALLKLDDQGVLEFHVLGNVGFNFTHPRLVLHGGYERENFADYVRAIQPHIGCVFSIWNETWCHTLTELWSVGLPALVTDYPTLADRVTSSGGGWVIEESEPQSVFEFLKTLMLDSHSISDKIAKVQTTQSETLIGQSQQLMAEEYLRVYEG